MHVQAARIYERITLWNLLPYPLLRKGKGVLLFLSDFFQLFKTNMYVQSLNVY